MSAVTPNKLSDQTRANKGQHIAKVCRTAADMITEIVKDYDDKTEQQLIDELGFRGANMHSEKYDGELALLTIEKWVKRERMINEAKLAFTSPPNVSAAATLEMAAHAGEAVAETPEQPGAQPKPDELMACGWPPMRSSDYWSDARKRQVHPGDVSAMADILDHLMTTSGHFRRSWEGSLARAAKVLQDNCDKEQMAAWNSRNGIRTPKYSTHKDAPESMVPPPKRARTDQA